MLIRDPKCVYVANQYGEAMAVANWLQHQGIQARMMDTMTLGGLEGLTGLVGVSSRGIEVWASTEEEAQRAHLLVAEHEEEIDQLRENRKSAAPVSAVCEECGATTTFPGELQGTIQNCPHCGATMDVEPDNADPSHDAEALDTESIDAGALEADTIEPPGRQAETPVHLSQLQGMQKPLITFVVSLFLGSAAAILALAALAYLLNFNARGH